MPDYETLKHVTRSLAEMREETRLQAVKAIRRLETAFLEALSGEPLQGLPNINPTRSNPVRGLRVRTATRDALLPQRYKNGWSEPTLCLDRRGHLVMISRNPSGDVGSRHVADDELRAEDLSHVASVYVEAADLHTERATSRTEQFAAAKRLADKINDFLEDYDER